MPHTRAAWLRALGLGAAAVLAPGVAGAQLPPVALRVGATISDPFAEPYYGKDARTFLGRGFDIDPTPLANAGAITAALAGGGLDLAVIDPVSCASAIIRGFPLQIIAGGALYTSKRPTYVLCAAKDSRVRNAKDFEGGTIAVSTLAGTGIASVKVWLAQHGADLEKIRFLELPMSSMTAAVLRGTVNGIVLAEPSIAPSRSEVRVIGQPLDAVAPEFMQTVWVATRDWLAADPARAKRAVQCIYDTARWANAHEDLTLVILARINKQDPDGLHAMVRTLYATGLMPAQLQPLLELAAKIKLIERPVPADELIARL